MEMVILALDGAFLFLLKHEILEKHKGSRIDKISQPSKDSFIFTFRGKNGTDKLLFSIRSDSPKIHFIGKAPENPATPPMLCMLFRKILTGARLNEITQNGLERSLCFNFDNYNELGDPVKYFLFAEIMGKHSNLILTHDNLKIIDALKRVDISMSSMRLVLPGLDYNDPPAQNKLNILTSSNDDIINAVINTKLHNLSKALMSSLQGFSPVICREISSCVNPSNEDFNLTFMPYSMLSSLSFQFDRIRNTLNNYTPVYTSITDGSVKKPLDFSFIDINQYDSYAVKNHYDNASDTLINFYSEKDRINYTQQKANDLIKLLNNLKSRIIRKINTQLNDIERYKTHTFHKLYGDLINANLYNIKSGASLVSLQNFYEPELPFIDVNLDPLLTPSQNAQKYYKHYKKSITALKILQEQIKSAENELNYIDSVLYSIDESQSEKELNSIREELIAGGYIKQNKNSRQKNIKVVSSPALFKSSAGFDILIGKNNRQNDRITIKDSSKSDIWLHVKDIPGCHTIIKTNAKNVDETTIFEAANLAAYHSKAKNSSNVAVDYTTVKNVKKPTGAKPGMVIYDNYSTIYVTPDEDLIKKLTV